MEFTDEQLTEIYKVANNEVGKARPLTTKSIFSAMRAIAQLVEHETLERAAKNFEEKDVYELFNSNYASREIRNLKSNDR